MDLLQFISATTQIVTAATAVITAYLAYQTYLKPPEQEDEPEPSSEVDESADEKLTETLVFKTSRQKTTLKVTPQGLECYLEDTREGKGGHQWTLSISDVRAILDAKAYHVNPGYKVKTGTFTLGPKRNWLYTKSLFPEPDYLESVLKSLLQNVEK
ncbi:MULTISPECIES: hypothetical protein [Pseudoalteromonas]|jgi:hypothetical protein|uniref:hypothetical protein n=1 Tax=Pseudoalteromonas TaxID=53246 RepID=UPI00029A9D83|nr:MULTISPECIES: hypothetical protein [Pseudoalteromonas]MCF2827592.1 hypothetical protein [Pseudoalteromonas sp. OF5H-5]MCF2830146.1 hypothetical protein [Pseudoalteromonas sp. DL2-H6]MCF2927239.1 hypothetical protein [Pseudoalteromonas sp. DL2-H1]QUI70553.1 hypothetical protein GSF13_12580 [Pseudoalteromonas sp. M8]